MEQQRRNDQDRLQQVKPPEAQSHQPPPPQKCPRCDSSNTKFCYYNNYSLSQPRYFCKSCRRYWTHGGTLRNVPVGGGCRKSKRPKPSAPASSSGAGSTQPLSPAFPSQNMISSGQHMRPLPPIMGNSFYGGGGGGGGSFLSSLAAMQSLSTGINQGATLNLGGGFDANMALMQGTTLQSLKSQLPPPPPSQFQLPNDHQYFQPQQNLSLPPRPSLPSWTQNFINRGPTTATTTTTTSAASSSFWSGASAADGENQAGSSFNPNHWQDSSNHQGFNPSSDQ